MSRFLFKPNRMKSASQKVLFFSFLIVIITTISAFIFVDNNLKNKTLVKKDEVVLQQKIKLPTIMVKGEKKSSPIELSELKISTKIVGTIAITTMDMLFYNDSTRILSGELYFPLNEGQTVSRFALDVNGKLRDGVVVEKAKGRIVFEKMVRRGIDPGLVELTKGNNFKTRIYPIPSKGYKRVVVSYEQELINNNEEIYYQLPLYFNEKVKKFSLDVEVQGKEIPQIKEGKLSNFQFKQWNENYKASFEKQNFEAQQELVIQIPQSNSGINTITEKAKNGNHYFFTNINPQLFNRKKQVPKSVCVVWDESNSVKNRNIEKELEVLEAYFTANPTIELRLITFANAVFQNKEFNNWKMLKNAILALKYDGATQLGVIPFKKIKEEEIIVVSDAIHTFGNSKIELTRKPVHILNSSTGADYALQKYITNSTGGQTINLSKATVSQAITQLNQVTYQFISSELLSGEAIEIYPKITQRVAGSFSVAGILKTDKVKLKLNFGYGDEVVWSQIVEINPSKSYNGKGIGSRIWAEKKLEDMNVLYEKNKDEITALGKAFSIVTKNTSLIVLDNVADYAENEIIPPTELLEEYTKLINTKNIRFTEKQADKSAQVLANWQGRVEWWNTEYKIPEPKKKYEWSDTEVRENNLIEREEDSEEEDDSWGDDGDDMETTEVVEEGITEQVEVVMHGTPLVGREGKVMGGRHITSTASRSILANNKPKESKKEITINEWKPDNEFYKILNEENPENCYSKYIELKQQEGSQPTFYADAGRVLFQKGKTKEAIRVISNLAELELENHELLKVVANTLMEWKEYELAVLMYKEILEQREEEPQSYRDLGLALHKLGKNQEAIEMLYQVVEKDWNSRFPQIENIVLGEINSIIANSKVKLKTDFMNSELKNHLPTDMRIVINWDADNVDIDLWVTDPRGEKCFYSHPNTVIGGLMSKDFTRGYGPEEFLIKKAIKGKYKIEVNYYGTSQQRVAGPPTIKAKLVTNYGKANESEKEIILRLSKSKEIVFIGELVVGEQ